MDLNTSYKLQSKNPWVSDVVLYLAVSLLVAAIICYFIFNFKIYLQQQELVSINQKMQNVGTANQKQKEEKIFDYQNKINDFAFLVNEHKFSSNIFNFIEQETLSDVWFYKFSMQQDGQEIVLSGEAENMEALSRQADVFEKSEYFQKVSLLNSSIEDAGRVNFNLNLSLIPELFEPLIEEPMQEILPESQAATEAESAITQNGQDIQIQADNNF